MNNNRSSFLDSIPTVVKNIIAINIILWLATLVLPSITSRWDIQIDLSDILGMHYWASEKFNVAQLFTYIFMHSTNDFTHILFNMFALYMFGGMLEYNWGSKRFLFYYLFTGVGAAIIQQIFWTIEFQSFINTMNNAILSNPSNSVELTLHKISELNKPITVGASGAVFGILLAFGWLFPTVELFMLFIPIPIKARIAVLIYGIMELFFGVFSSDNVAHFAHLGGMLFGIILILVWKKNKKIN